MGRKEIRAKNTLFMKSYNENKCSPILDLSGL